MVWLCCLIWNTQTNRTLHVAQSASVELGGPSSFSTLYFVPDFIKDLLDEDDDDDEMASIEDYKNSQPSTEYENCDKHGLGSSKIRRLNRVDLLYVHPFLVLPIGNVSETYTKLAEKLNHTFTFR